MNDLDKEIQFVKGIGLKEQKNLINLGYFYIKRFNYIIFQDNMKIEVM